MLHSRHRTSRPVESDFGLGKYDCRLIDVGGCRAERKHWAHLFDGVHCLIFTVSLSGYDECLIEDRTAVGSLFSEALSLGHFVRC